MSDVLTIATSALIANAKRLNLTASNIANVDSGTSSTGQPYKGRYAVFAPFALDAAEPQVAGVRVSAIVEKNSPPRRKYDPASPLADAHGFVTLPNVNIAEEMTDMISASRSYQNNLAVMQIAKELQQKTLQLGQ